jgi:uncharacterized protein
MESRELKIPISESLGEVSAGLLIPAEPKVIMTIAHGAGAGMSHPFLINLSHDLAQYGIATLRFNLHYMEQRKKRPDPPAIAHKVIERVIHRANALFPSLPLIAAGKSFGGRMTSQLMSKENLPMVRGIVFYGFPLHPANSPGIERADHLTQVKVPMLFLQGTKDTLAEVSLIESAVKKLPLASLEMIPNADHSFKIGKKDSIVDLSRKTVKWLEVSNILR